ncbi:hypothetical protein AL526_004710 [Citrobacter koseri]|nr:hypothetical protein AL526_004710 [Citrobacter koseri]
MRLGGHSGSGKLGITILSLLVSSGVHADAVTADGFGRVIQQMVETREAQVVSQSAGRVFATGASSLGMGAGIAVAAEVIRERPDVLIQSACVARKWVTLSFAPERQFSRLLMALRSIQLTIRYLRVFQVLAVI